MKIQIKGILISTVIGYYPYERDNTQEVMADLDVELYYGERDSLPDDLTATIDYDQLIDYVVSIASQTRYILLESLAQCLADKLLEHFELIKRVNINLTKKAICGVKALEIAVNYTKQREFKVALALGSNWEFLPQQQLINAIEMLGEYVNRIEIGSFYETRPVGYVNQRNFYNTAITGYTPLSPEQLLGKIKFIEKLMGKAEIMPNGPRIIDIDLILYANLIYTRNFLIIPHQRAHLRDFVLVPLQDIAPNWVHPGLNKTIRELVDELEIGSDSILTKLEYTHCL